MAISQRTKLAGESLGFFAVTAGVLALLNILGFFWFARADITEKRLFSLSDGSQRLAGNLHDKMEIVAYFTSDLPPPFNATERYVRDILTEYEAASHGNIRVRFVNPDTDEKRQQAERDGVNKVSHQVIENDSFNVVEGYRGIAFKYLGESRAIPVVQDTSGLEYSITMIMKQLANDRTPIGVLSGHGGPTLEKGLSGLREALPTYDVREINAAQPITREIKALLIVSPETEIPEPELRNINAFVMAGGSLGVFGGTTKIDPEGQEMSAVQVNTGVNRLIDNWGWRLGDNLVADAQCGRAPMQTMLGIPMLVPYPPVPIVTFDEGQREHPALFRLDQAILPFTSSLGQTQHGQADRLVKRTVLARSSEQSWLLTGDSISVRPRSPREWDQSGRRGPFVLAAALSGQLPTAFPAAAQSTPGQPEPPADNTPARVPATVNHGKGVRVLIVGTASFMRDEFLPRADPRTGQRDLTSALAFALNAIDWLAADEDLIAIRAKNVEDPALEVPAAVKQADADAHAAAQAGDREEVKRAIERNKAATEAWETKKLYYKVANVAGMPILLLVFGLVRWRMRVARKANVKL